MADEKKLTTEEKSPQTESKEPVAEGLKKKDTPNSELKPAEKAEEDVKDEKNTAEAKAEVKPEVKEEKPTETPKAEENSEKETERSEAKVESVEPNSEQKQAEATEVKTEEKQTLPKATLMSQAPNEVPEKKARRFHLPGLGLRRKKTDDVVEKNSADEVMVLEEPVTAEEVVNNLDADVTIKSQSKAAMLAQQVDEQMKEAQKGDYIEIKVHKKKLIVFLGFLVILMWIIPITKAAQTMLIPEGSFKIPFLNKDSEEETIVEQQNKEVVSEASESGGLKVRVKYHPEDEQAANLLAGTLKEQGFEYVDVMIDENITSGISVATKAEGLQKRIELEDWLKQEYEVASTSAELSADSDFDAVILFNPE